MNSTPSAATTGWQLAGVATVTRPAPLRSAPRALSTAAPVLPRDPATISTRPQSPLWASGARGCTSARTESRVRRWSRGPSTASTADIGMPMSAITTSPATCSAGGRTSGTFGAASVTVRSASSTGPGSSLVSADSPDGRSIATTVAAEALTSATIVSWRPVSARLRPVPTIASTMTSAAVTCDPCSSHAWASASSTIDRPSRPMTSRLTPGIAADVGQGADHVDVDVDAALLQRAGDDEAVTAVAAGPAQHGNAPRRQVVDAATPSPPPPGGRRSPSGRSTGCRCRRSSGDRRRASAWH